MTLDVPEARPEFGAELAVRLANHSGRALAAKSHWGRTVVNEIKSGRRTPTDRQLRDLLRAVGADSHEIEHWSARLREMNDPGSRQPASDQATKPPADAAPVALDTRRPSLRKVIAVLAALALCAVVVIVLTQHGRASRESPLPTQPISASEAAQSPSPSTEPSEPSGAITKPASEVEASSTIGVELAGTAADDGTGTFWLIDHDSEGVYTPDTAIDVKAGGIWSTTDKPIAEPADVPTRMTILLVHANDNCGSYLRKKAAVDGTFTSMPASCSVMDSVAVNITRK